jgi:dihydroorotate dehydrogenase electron transfer subunit
MVIETGIRSGARGKEAGSRPDAVHLTATILENVPIARATYLLRLAAPAIARSILPGQFVMVRPTAAGSDDPLLGRPLALYDVVRSGGGEPEALDLVYLVVGRGTAALSRRQPGERLSVWGPLGNGFGEPPAGPVIFVAGGIGQTPFLALGRWWLGRASYGTMERATKGPGPGPGLRRTASSATLLYGVRTAEFLAGLEDFQSAGIEIEVATDDGSAGYRGWVTDLLARRFERGERPARVVGCGPPLMLATLARLTGRHGIACDVSLENHMACGFGACFSCVAPIRQPDGSLDLRRLCVEGPVVSAAEVEWTRLIDGPDGASS